MDHSGPRWKRAAEYEATLEMLWQGAVVLALIDLGFVSLLM